MQPSRTGFEPVRGNPIGFRVQRLNHSATVTPRSIHRRVLTGGVRAAAPGSPRAPGLPPLAPYSPDKSGWTEWPGEAGLPAREELGPQGAHSDKAGDGEACGGSDEERGLGSQGRRLGLLRLGSEG